MKSFRDLAKWYFSRGALPYWSILLLDCLFVVLAGVAAYIIHHEVPDTWEAFEPLVWTICAGLVCFLIGFRMFHTYSGVIRFSSFTDLLRIGSAVVTAIVLLFLVQGLLAPRSLLTQLSVADIVVWGLLVIAVMWTVRVMVKTV